MKTILCAALLSASALSSTASLAQPTPRQQVQHLLRRFAFSVPPETVTAVEASGTAAWLAQQEQPSLIDDFRNRTRDVADQLVNGGCLTIISSNGGRSAHDADAQATPGQARTALARPFRRRPRQGRRSGADVSLRPGIRANALGNFATLLTAVAEESAMLEWLDNNWNVGPVANENFARESHAALLDGHNAAQHGRLDQAQRQRAAAGELHPGGRAEIAKSP